MMNVISVSVQYNWISLIHQVTRCVTFTHGWLMNNTLSCMICSFHITIWVYMCPSWYFVSIVCDKPLTQIAKWENSTFIISSPQVGGFIVMIPSICVCLCVSKLWRTEQCRRCFTMFTTIHNFVKKFMLIIFLPRCITFHQARCTTFANVHFTYLHVFFANIRNFLNKWIFHNSKLVGMIKF